MKNSLLVPIVFIVNFCCWLAACALFFGIYRYLTVSPETLEFLFYAVLHYLYLFTPLACAIAIFSVYVFLMRHSSRTWLSFLLLFLTFIVVFIVIIPAIYSQSGKIDAVYSAYEIKEAEDGYLQEFIEPPFIIKNLSRFIYPVLEDTYNMYIENFLYYIIFSGSFFILILSFWVCTILTEWKMINFILMPFFTLLSIYAYNFASKTNFSSKVKYFLPFSLQDIFVLPICLLAVSTLFLIYTGILMYIRKPGFKRSMKILKERKIRPSKPQRPPKPKKEKNRNSRRQPRQSRRSRISGRRSSFDE